MVKFMGIYTIIIMSQDGGFRNHMLLEFKEKVQNFTEL